MSIEEFAVASIARALELIKGNEAQRRGIDAVAQAACLAWTIGEDMAKVAVPLTGANFSSSHAVAIVSLLHHVLRFEWLGEARPTRGAVELVDRSKQRLAGHDVYVNAWFFVIPIGILKGSF